MSCLGNCGKDIRNPPSRKITGYCAKCLGLAHKRQLKVELTTEILDKLNLKEKEITSKKLLDKEIDYKIPKCKKHKTYCKVCTSHTGTLGLYCDKCQQDWLVAIRLDKKKGRISKDAIHLNK